MEATEHTMTSWDGVELFYRAWIPRNATNKALLLFHRGHEHSGRWQETVESLDLQDVAVFGWDARGHGRSPGERGAANQLADIVRDVDAFVRHISGEHGIAWQDMIVLAHSLAAVSVTAWVHDYAPPIRAMILATAAFHVKLYVPFAIPALRLKQKLLGRNYVKSYVKSRMLTHDQEQAARYDADPLIFRQIAVNVLLDLHDTAKRLVADAGAIDLPTLMLGAEKDWVVSLNAQRRFFDRLSSSFKRMHVFAGAYHAIFHETNRREVVNHVRAFVRERFARSPVVPSLLNADQSGYTWQEYKRFKQHTGVKFAIVRAGLKTAGRLSNGVDLGWRSGFDSGLSLDYVYRNEPAGAMGLGRLIDKSYLNSVGWRGIRQRKANLEKALKRVIGMLRGQGRPVRILDVAAGAGRYVIEIVREMARIPMSALLRDVKQENVDAARALAEEFDLGRVTVERGDAFDRNSLAAIQPRPTIGIVSGLYELFPVNEGVMNSLRGLADAVEPDGYLIYTNQPWHPQVEFIAGVLRNREGQPWIMRRRTTAEMDQLVRAAGFEKTFETLATSIGLSVLFLVVYGGCNWITSQRSDIGTFYFQWERTIPFVPSMVLPYLSIDLFFIAAPFLCRTNRELRIFSRRIVAAILVAGIFFLLCPLRFAFPRPQVDGWIGAVFNWFRGMDAPFNLLPSLHAAFWMFLLDIYMRHTRGLLLGAVIVWFTLIGLSPVLTYQHHAIDIIGGLGLAGYCFYFFQEASTKLPIRENERIGFYYGSVALLLLALVLILWPLGALLLWPTFSLGIVAAGYFGLGPVIFRKTNGKLPWSTRFVLGPNLIGQYLSLVYYRRQCRSWDEVTPNIWIGRKLNDGEAAVAVAAGVRSVLDLSAEFSEAKPFRSTSYRNIPILDLTAPTLEQLREMGAFIGDHSQHGTVYVHCKIGYSRSAAAVAAYLIMNGEADDVEEALAIIRRARPSIVVRPEIVFVLSELKLLCAVPVRAENFFCSLPKNANRNNRPVI